jgi:hypothetical protein
MVGRSDRRRRRRHAARVSSARGIHYTGPSERRRRSRTKPRSVERSAVTAAAAAKGVRARLRSGNCLLHYLRQQPRREEGGQGEGGPDLAPVEAAVLVLAAFITALAAFLAAGAKTATLSKTLSYKAKRH